ncbi:MAG: PAS domain S-box protein, partial [candidate division Zixibacteria bacterium]|nr:PAS domain S-box protein [candidate division Zixibacteria bacterium]
MNIQTFTNMSFTGQKTAAKKNSDERLPLFSALNPLSTTLLSHHDLDQILDQAVRQIKKIFKVKSCGIFLLNEKGILEFKKGLGLSKHFQKAFDSQISPKPTQEILNRIYPKISDDSLVDYKKNKSLCDLMRRENIHKEISIPLKVKNRLIGILNIGRDSSCPDFSERDLRLLNTFGSQIAITTSNAKLYQQLKKSSEVYGNLIEGAPDSIVAVDLKGNITYCNKATEILTGYTKEELIGKHFNRVGWIKNKDIPHYSKLFKEFLNGKKVAPFEMQVRHKDGKLFWIEVHISRIKARGKVTGIQVNVRNITERKQAEESSKQKVLALNSFINNIPDMAWLKDDKSRFIALNKAFGEVAGTKPETLIGQTCEACFGAKAGKKFREDDLKVMKGRKQVSLEEKIVDSGGKELWLETIKSPIFGESGKVVGTVGIARNVTDRKRIEKALVQKERIARERARLLNDLRSLDRIDDILTRVCKAVRDSGLFERAVMTLHKPKGRIVHLGQVGLPLNVVERARCAPPMDDKLRSLITSKKFRISDSFFIPAEAGVDFSKTGRYIPQKRKNSVGGNWQPGDELFVPLRDFSEEIMGYLSVDTPTDGRRPDVKTIQALEMLVEAAAARVREVEAHDALKREHDFSQSIIGTANSLIVCLDANAKITVFNQECERITGYRREEVLGKPWPELFLPPDHRHFKLKSFAKWVRAHPRDQYEGPIVTKSGKIRTILWSNTAILGSGKKDVLAIALGQDITERKRAEEALQISQERYKLSTKSANVGIWDWDIKTNKFYIDPNVKEILGYKDEEIPNDIEVWVTYVHPDDREPVMAAAQACLDGKTPEYVFEHRMRHKDGSVRWLLTRGNVIRDAKGNAVRMVGTDTDITERKRAEEALQVSENKYRTLLENLPQKIFLKD